jgi:hypothetical protein
VFDTILERIARALDEATIPYMVIGGQAVLLVEAGRPRDLEDVIGVLLKNPGLDLSHIRPWLREFARELEQPYDDQFEALVRRSRS